MTEEWGVPIIAKMLFGFFGGCLMGFVAMMDGGPGWSDDALVSMFFGGSVMAIGLAIFHLLEVWLEKKSDD